ncbi:hypothetical protein ACTMNS_11565 [Staphylococcus haemolyticus]
MQNSIKEYVLSGEFEQVRQLMAKADFLDKRRTKNAKAFHDKCENAYLGCWVWG